MLNFERLYQLFAWSFEKLEGNVNHYKFIKQREVIYKSKDYSSLGIQKTLKNCHPLILKDKTISPHPLKLWFFRM